MIRAIATLFALLAVANALSRTTVMKPFVSGNAFKVIAGLNNFDAVNVRNVVAAAAQGGASHVDLACDANLVKIAKTITGDSMPICVSSIKPADFVAAVAAGADMVEIGNFDAFYDQGLKFTADDVISMTIETRNLLPEIPLSVTIPHTLTLSEQIELAKRLEECGADIIQTEGKMCANIAGMGVQELIEAAAPTIASAFALSRAVSIPVMCASGLTDVTAPLAIAAGARGVGIGSMVNKLPSQQQMLMAVSAIAAALGRSTQAGNSNVDAEMSAQIVSAPVKMTA
jgi:thiamine monophosphate synthase